MQTTDVNEQPVDFEADLQRIRNEIAAMRQDPTLPYRPSESISAADLKRPRDVRREYREGKFGRKQLRYRGVDLIWTDCNFGGVRPWFVCPGCGYRVALLFRHECRRCMGLRYQSQYDRRLDRVRAKAAKIRGRLGDRGGLFALVPHRPKRMRQTTYDQLLSELEAVESEAARIVAPEIPGFQKAVRRRFADARAYNAMRRKYAWMR